mmetsp:Transcript_105260/g.193019  ORF Transcript_105260/g.193019 Transcript_105260/m.193019 type:complete len:346 (-) Transcript_105260:50-1087(-)
MMGFALPDLVFLFTGLHVLPSAIMAILIGVAAVSCFVRFACFKIRDCSLLKRLLLWVGHDEFEDFELMVLVHETTWESKELSKTKVRVTAGKHVAYTDASPNGIFQQPLHILVEQGTRHVSVDLLDGWSRVQASLTLQAAEQVLLHCHKPEKLYKMNPKNRKICSPTVKLSMVVSTGADAEQGLLSDKTSDVNLLVRQQFLKCDEGLSEIEVLTQSCTGPLEFSGALGTMACVWVAPVGPPTSQRWMFSIWRDKHDFDQQKSAVLEIDLLKIQSVQADPNRDEIFVITYYDESRVQQTATFRRMDRARDVWVEILQQRIERAHASHMSMKRERATKNQRQKTPYF